MTRIEGFRFSNAILCEEIRQEKNNKFIIIGVFSGNIIVQSLPVNLGLSIYIDGEAENIGQRTFWLKLAGPGESEAIISAAVDAKKVGELITIATPRLGINVECEGDFCVSVSSDQKNWTELITKEITQSEDIWSLSSISSEPPPELSPNDAQD